MQIINYLSTAAVPAVILIIITYGIIEKNKVYDTFLEGAKEGLKIVIQIFPTFVGIFLAVGALRASGIIDLIIQIIKPAINMLKIPAEIMPLAMLRPISGSASMAVATDIMSKHGVDSIIRTYSFNNNGLYRNDFLYHSIIHKCSRNKENKICISSIFNCRYSRYAYICSNLSNYVVIFLLTYLEK